MKNKMGIGGRVAIEITRADGTVEHLPEHDNDIENALKAKITDTLQAASTYGISQTSLFNGSYFSAPAANESGIVVTTSSSTYESETTELSSGDNKVYKFQGIVRASDTKVLNGAKIGYKWIASSTNAFTTLHASDTFSQTLNDGDQLTITWTITLDDA